MFWKNLEMRLDAFMSTSSATSDVLTGFPDREACLVALEAAIDQDAEGVLCLAILDIDLLGQINERAGRDAGDALIQVLAGALARRFSGEAGIFRIGGDAFALQFCGCEKEAVFLSLEAFRDSFDGPHDLDAAGKRAPLSATLSIGLAACPEDGGAAQVLYQKASEALYRAKVSGRNKVCLAREEKKVTKTSHYTQGQLLGLRRLAEREGHGEAALLREALNDLLRKYNA